MAYETFWEEKGIKWVFSGDLTNENLLKCNKELYNDKRFLDIKYELCDFSLVKNFNINSDTVYKVAKMDLEYSLKNPDIKVAIIANDLVLTGFTRMYQIINEPSAWETEIFKNEKDAREWLKKIES